MKCKFVIATLTMTISQLVSAQGNDLGKTNDRIDQLERRLAAYENNSSDGKMLGNQNNSGKSPVASTIKGVDLKMYGDVEFDADLSNRSDGIFSNRSSAFTEGEGEKWGLGGRIKVGIDADQKSASGNYVGVSVQPLAKMNGKVGLDDAFIKFGSKPDEWEIKVGRYEAYDMFPLNNDTFIDYSGNGSNELYSDGSSYVYQMKEGRGRTNDSMNGGGILFSKTVDNWYLETNVQVEDGSGYFKNGEYHGNSIENRKNAIILRPVVAYTNGPWTAAVAFEGNVINNAYGYENANGHFVDQSKRNGYGFNLNHNTLSKDGSEGALISFSTAYLDAKNENDFSVGINGLHKNLEVGYIFAHNDIDKYNGLTSYSGSCSTDCDLRHPGSYNIHTVHASYRIPGILGFDNFDAYVGAYASAVESSALRDGEGDSRFGVRGRLKYYF